ncbi:hypothetical protein [Geomonas subterranea]|uniref:hypothetical protein n=1 Tax=Geomonas subterranea TaxID=2847989 RepID=UPI001CD2583B|nr:hypothetical protein [Geomonas fuzhouensis]
MLPKYHETQQILSDFRSARTPREKREVISNVKKRFPKIAERLSKLADEDKEGSR